MSSDHPLARLGRAIFSGIPTPLLAVVSLTLLGVLGLDLIAWDPIPLLDELVLGFLLYGSTSTLLRRRGGQLAGPASEPVPVGRLSRALESDVRDLGARATALRRAGTPVPALDGLVTLSADSKAIAEEVRESDVYLSRKENDPWQVARGVERLEQAVADAEAAGDRGRMDTLEVALSGARMHHSEVLDRSARRDVVVSRMQALSGQVATLNETLRVIADRGAIPAIREGLGAGWDPRLAAVLEGLREAREAEGELDEAVAARLGTSPARRQRA